MPASQMTAERVLAWKDRWKAVNRREIEELRAKTMDQKLAELEMLFQAAREFGRHDSSSAETEVARSRWLKLRRAYDKPA